MKLKILEVKGKGGGKSKWDEKEIAKIVKDVEKSIETNGFAILEREKVGKAYKGTAKDNYRLVMIRRKVYELFGEKYNIEFYGEIIAEDEKGKTLTFKDVYLIKPKE